MVSATRLHVKTKLVKSALFSVWLLVFLGGSSLFAAPDAYDAVARLIQPLATVLAKDPPEDGDRSFVLRAELEQMTDLPKEMKGASFELRLEPPDRVLLRAPLLGQPVTIARRKQKLWIHPGSQVQALLSNPDLAEKLPPLRRGVELEDVRLPFSRKQLVFLPALLQVREAGEVMAADERCRGLDVRLMPELASMLEEDGPPWAARLAVDPEGRLRKLTVARAGWSMTLLVHEFRAGKSLPKEAWQPTAEQAADVLEISAERFDQLLRAVTGGM